MTSLDPLSAERLTEIQKLASVIAWESGAPLPRKLAGEDVPALLAEVERLKAELADYVAEQVREQDRLRALLINPDYLAERARELRAIDAEAEYEAEIDRLADGGEV